MLYIYLLLLISKTIVDIEIINGFPFTDLYLDELLSRIVVNSVYTKTLIIKAWLVVYNLSFSPFESVWRRTYVLRQNACSTWLTQTPPWPMDLLDIRDVFNLTKLVLTEWHFFSRIYSAQGRNNLRMAMIRTRSWRSLRLDHRGHYYGSKQKIRDKIL